MNFGFDVAPEDAGDLVDAGQSARVGVQAQELVGEDSGDGQVGGQLHPCPWERKKGKSSMKN